MPTREDSPENQLVSNFLSDSGVNENKDLITGLLLEAASLSQTKLSRLDLKILRSSLMELRQAFDIFTPYRARRKVTIFGSARLTRDDANYKLAADVAKLLANNGWMVVTGGGPGIMTAGIEGAGAENAFGINIRLPFEQGPSEALANDPKSFEMKYFFTRKLMLMKESDAFISLPGGLGTLDETFELLTLMQTGKAQLAPMILLDPPGYGYWNAVSNLMSQELLQRGFISEADLALFSIHNDPKLSAQEIEHYYLNFHSLRWVGNLLVLRMKYEIDPLGLATINEKFGDLGGSRGIIPGPPTRVEVSGEDHLELHRLYIHFDKRSYGRLKELINFLNDPLRFSS